MPLLFFDLMDIEDETAAWPDIEDETDIEESREDDYSEDSYPDTVRDKF